MSTLKYLLFTLSINSFTAVCSQTPAAKGLDFGVSYFTYTSPEIKYSSLFDIKLNKGDNGMRNKYMFTNPAAGIEFQAHPDFILAPKLSLRGLLNVYEYSGITLGGEYIYYTDFSKAQSVIRPQAGFHFFFGTIELLYSYNFIIGQEKINTMNRHVITLSFKPFIFITAISSLGEHE